MSLKQSTLVEVSPLLSYEGEEVPVADEEGNELDGKVFDAHAPLELGPPQNLVVPCG